LAAGNRGFTISIDGPTPETYSFTRPLRVFPHLLKHVRYLSDRIQEIRESGGMTHSLSINNILHKGNYKEAHKMIDLALELKVDSISFMPLIMPPDVEDQKLTEWQRSYTSQLIPTSEECLESALLIGRRIDPRFNADVANLDVQLKFLSPVARDYLAVEHDVQLPLVGRECAAVTRIGSLNHDGMMVICEAFDHAHEAVEAGVIQAKPLSLREHSFWDIWNSESYQQMFSWAFKEDIYDYMDPCYRCPHLKTICPLPRARHCACRDRQAGALVHVAVSRHLAEGRGPVRVEGACGRGSRSSIGRGSGNRTGAKQLGPSRLNGGLMAVYPTRVWGIKWATRTGGLLLYSPYSFKLIALNHTAAAIWMLSSG
jgi:MoaA/NifB/PqqE/SkfB family radical SAM enzyme